jgi:hypothetical protein
MPFGSQAMDPVAVKESGAVCVASQVRLLYVPLLLSVPPVTPYVPVHGAVVVADNLALKTTVPLRSVSGSSGGV